MGSTIPLAKALNTNKMTFPALLSEKYDGVPVRIDHAHNASIGTQTRQGKAVPSISDTVRELGMFLRGGAGLTLIGEVVQSKNHRAPFRETGGIVRRQEPQEGLDIMIFDGAIHGEEDLPFSTRMRSLQELLSYCMLPEIKFVRQQRVNTLEAFEFQSKGWMDAHPDAEGMVLRSMSDKFEPGKRQWGYQKVLREPTIDLRIVGAEEAIDKHGEPKGMVGGLIAMYKGNQIGVGPGKMTHAERAQIAAECGFGIWNGPRIAEIKHKGDGSYDALRQPTFQHWRDDKDKPDA